MRHAHSAHPGGVRDHDRPLTESGRSAAALAGDWLRSHLDPVGEVLCSTAVRAQQTAEAAGVTAPIRLDAGVYDADPQDILRLIRSTDESVRTLLVVGHSPGIPALAGRLATAEADHDPAAQDPPAHETTAHDPADEWHRRFPTATMAVLDFPGDWADLADGAARKVAIRIPPD